MMFNVEGRSLGLVVKEEDCHGFKSQRQKYKSCDRKREKERAKQRDR